MKFPECVNVIVRFGPVPAALIVVGSAAVLFAVFVSPPPETTAVFVTVAAAFAATLTVTWIGG